MSMSSQIGQRENAPERLLKALNPPEWPFAIILALASVQIIYCVEFAQAHAAIPDGTRYHIAQVNVQYLAAD